MLFNIHLFRKKENAEALGMNTSTDFSMKAYRDWKILLLSAIVISVVVIALEVYLFWRVNYGDIFMAPSIIQNEATVTDEKLFENITNFFDERTAKFEAWKIVPGGEIDPSL